MIIKLIGALPQELKDRDLKPGDKYEAEPAQGTKLGAVRFKVQIDGIWEWCTVWPENFIKIA